MAQRKTVFNYKGRLHPIVNTLDFVDIVAASS